MEKEKEAKKEGNKDRKTKSVYRVNVPFLNGLCESHTLAMRHLTHNPCLQGSNVGTNES